MSSRVRGTKGTREKAPRCPKCKDLLPEYPRNAGSCKCGFCKWIYVADAGWFDLMDGMSVEKYKYKKKLQRQRKRKKRN